MTVAAKLDSTSIVAAVCGSLRFVSHSYGPTIIYM